MWFLSAMYSNTKFKVSFAHFLRFVKPGISQTRKGSPKEISDKGYKRVSSNLTERMASLSVVEEGQT